MCVCVCVCLICTYVLYLKLGSAVTVRLALWPSPVWSFCVDQSQKPFDDHEVHQQQKQQQQKQQRQQQRRQQRLRQRLGHELRCFLFT